MAEEESENISSQPQVDQATQDIIEANLKLKKRESSESEDKEVEAPAGCHGCSTTCGKMDVFDWMALLDIPDHQRFDILEIRFKNGKKEFFRNSAELILDTGDAVVLDVPNGHHVGFVSLQGELVRYQMKKKGVADNDEVREIYRKATEQDLEKYNKVADREFSTLIKTKEILSRLKLRMKLTDVEYQADNKKATFYYSADERVDFRDLIKELAAQFKVRIEMRQISMRQEAGRLGGIGSCGRELCCSTWMTDFKSVSTSAAKYQNLSLNPGKLSGQCGRLKCCLNYELDAYMDALKDIPVIENPLETQQGLFRLQKTDIFKRMMWFSFERDNNWTPITMDRVKEVMEMNKKGKKPENLSLVLVQEAEKQVRETPNFDQDLEALDRKYRKPSKKKKKKRKFDNKSGQHSKGEKQEGGQSPKGNQHKSNHKNKNRNKNWKKNKPQNPKKENA